MTIGVAFVTLKTVNKGGIKGMKAPTKRQYEKAEKAQAVDYAPDIYPCKKCGWPVVSGYICNYCGDTNPSYEEDS